MLNIASSLLCVCTTSPISADKPRFDLSIHQIGGRDKVKYLLSNFWEKSRTICPSRTVSTTAKYVETYIAAVYMELSGIVITHLTRNAKVFN